MRFIDKDTGRVVSAKSVKLFPDLMQCCATFVEPPRRGEDMPAVEITLPDGRSVRSDADDVDSVLSGHFRRNLTLARSCAGGLHDRPVSPRRRGCRPGGRRDKVVAQPLGSALFAAIGEESPLPVGSFLDAFPISVITTSTLAHLAELQPGTRFDERRFRMNVVVDTEQPGFLENNWLNRVPVPRRRRADRRGDPRSPLRDDDPGPARLAQGHRGPPRARPPQQAASRHHGPIPLRGVYAVVTSPGRIRIGDPVVLRLSRDDRGHPSPG